MGYYGYGMGYYFDPTYILVLIGAVLCIWAQARVSSTYNKFSRVRSRTGMTGAQAAQKILQMSGIYDVRIEHVGGSLTDHYDPVHKVLRLSDSVYGSTSVAAIGVAAHECGHAVQHDKGYAPLKIRSALVPAANIGDSAYPSGRDSGNEPDAHPDRHLGVCARRALSGGDPACGVQRIRQGARHAGGLRYAGAGRDGGMPESAESGGSDLCGGGSVVDPAASAAGAVVRQQKPGRLRTARRLRKG